MAVVGSTIRIDFHLTEDGDVETVREAVRQGTAVAPALASQIRETVRETAQSAFDGAVGDQADLSVDVALVTERVPGAPRERIQVTMDFEGDDSALAAVDDAVSPPDRARLADALEATTAAFLEDEHLHRAVELTVSVTPIEFR
jgi:hypothetical protein